MSRKVKNETVLFSHMSEVVLIRAANSFMIHLFQDLGKLLCLDRKDVPWSYAVSLVFETSFFFIHSRRRNIDENHDLRKRRQW